MDLEELNSLLQELTTEDLSTDRQLEIFGLIRSDKEKSIQDMKELTDNTSKLQSDYDKLKKKTVDDFFNKGTEINSDKVEKEENPEENKSLEIDDLILSEEDMAKLA